MTSKAYRSLNFLKFRINGQLGEKKGAKKKKNITWKFFWYGLKVATHFFTSSLLAFYVYNSIKTSKRHKTFLKSWRCCFKINYSIYLLIYFFFFGGGDTI